MKQAFFRFNNGCYILEDFTVVYRSRIYTTAYHKENTCYEAGNSAFNVSYGQYDIKLEINERKNGVDSAFYLRKKIF